MIASDVRWHVYAAAGILARAAERCILSQAEHAITQRGAFRIVLAGGSTPRAVYGRLARANSDWARWHIYFGDERCLPVDAEQRNDTMARSQWLDHVSIPANQIHAIPAELGSHEGAEAYNRVLQGTGDFDLVLLGLGEDGHTASLFPGHYAGAAQDAPDVLAVSDAPKPPAARISLSANRLSRSRSVKLLVTGNGKRTAIGQLCNRENIPVCGVTPASGLDVLLDEAARIPAID